MTVDEKYTYCCAYSEGDEHMSTTFDFIVSVDGLNDESIDRWCFYWFGMEFDAFYDEVIGNE